MADQEEHHTFEEIAHTLQRNLQSLRVFTARLGEVAAAHDEQALRDFSSVFTEIFPLDLLGERPPSESDKTPELTEEQKERIREIISAPGAVQKLRDATKVLNKAAPHQSVILRESAVVSLMSYFEALVADLVHAYYMRHPAAMPADDRTLSLSELRELGSIEEAERFVVAKEVDALLRENVEAQLRYFTKRPKINLDHIEEYKPMLIELSQRRNLLVHNRGVVNRTYLERVDVAIAEKVRATSGERLVTDNDYLAGALDLVEVIGTFLVQLCWRKWERSGADSADSVLIETVFESLVEGRFWTVERVAAFAEQLELGDDSTRRVICINHAIALRDSGRSPEVENVLRNFDWSAASLRFQMALLAVRDDADAFYGLLPRAIAAEEVALEELASWPLFRNLRDQPRFRVELEQIFSAQAVAVALEAAYTDEELLPRQAQSEGAEPGEA